MLTGKIICATASWTTHLLVEQFYYSFVATRVFTAGSHRPVLLVKRVFFVTAAPALA